LGASPGPAIVDVGIDVRNVAITVNPAVAVKGLYWGDRRRCHPTANFSLADWRLHSRCALHTGVCARGGSGRSNGAFSAPSVRRFRIGSISGLINRMFARMAEGFRLWFSTSTITSGTLVVLNRGAGVIDGVVSMDSPELLWLSSHLCRKQTF
jgi:hypothetical protein